MATRLISLSLIGLVSALWFLAVIRNVPKPYLDEYFHVRQALEYWRGNWVSWDPKITTPPGLYAASYLWLFLLNVGGPYFEHINQLRSINQFLGIPGIYSILLNLLRSIYDYEFGISINSAHDAAISDIARNATIFPPLFFFCALYYTDVLSVLAVLFCYALFHAQQPFLLVMAGVVSLSFRQNNIFWCAVYLGGMEVVRSLERDENRESVNSLNDAFDVVKVSWQTANYYDPFVHDAGIEDYILSAISIGVATIVKWPYMVQRLSPYLTLLALFGGFIVWNGSVVLGDKSNHVASLHLPQMLYIWPYFTFFSFFAMLPHIMAKTHAIINHGRPIELLGKVLPRWWVAAIASIVSLLAIQYNSIIHPFTLADNRHYTFYVFKIFRLYPFFKYTAVPIYLFCAWASFIALASPASSLTFKHASPGTDAGPSTSSSVKLLPGAQKPGTVPRHGNRVSFVLVWLLSSALGLVTAPLVEPRYYILPWLMWRLHVQTVDVTTWGLGYSAWDQLTTFVVEYASWLETACLLAVNAVTMYLFINWGFYWKQEPGEVQRFMW